MLDKRKIKEKKVAAFLEQQVNATTDRQLLRGG